VRISGISIRAVRFLDPRTQIVAFEPIPALYERLCAEFEPPDYGSHYRLRSPEELPEGPYRT
jgi:hypothetical protein